MSAPGLFIPKTKSGASASAYAAHVSNTRAALRRVTKSTRPAANNGASSLPIEYVYVSSASAAAIETTSLTAHLSFDDARRSASRNSTTASGYAATSKTMRLDSYSHGVSSADSATTAPTAARLVTRAANNPNSNAASAPNVALNSRAAVMLGPVTRKTAASA